MGQSWEGIHLPDQKVKYLEELIEQEKITPDSAIGFTNFRPPNELDFPLHCVIMPHQAVSGRAETKHTTVAPF